LLEADNDRTPYKAGLDTFVVSPVNARKQLLALIHRAEKELFIYDPKIADPEMLRALKEKARKSPSPGSPAQWLPAAHAHHYSGPA
jgi:hypothetical protein